MPCGKKTVSRLHFITYLVNAGICCSQSELNCYYVYRNCKKCLVRLSCFLPYYPVFEYFPVFKYYLKVFKYQLTSIWIFKQHLKTGLYCSIW